MKIRRFTVFYFYDWAKMDMHIMHAIILIYDNSSNYSSTLDVTVFT